MSPRIGMTGIKMNALYYSDIIYEKYLIAKNL